MWHVIEVVNGVETADYGSITAANIRSLVKSLSGMLGVSDLYYIKDEYTKGVYYIHNRTDHNRHLMATKYN